VFRGVHAEVSTTYVVLGTSEVPYRCFSSIGGTEGNPRIAYCQFVDQSLLAELAGAPRNLTGIANRLTIRMKVACRPKADNPWESISGRNI